MNRIAIVGLYILILSLLIIGCGTNNIKGAPENTEKNDTILTLQNVAEALKKGGLDLEHQPDLPVKHLKLNQVTPLRYKIPQGWGVLLYEFANSKSLDEGLSNVEEVFISQQKYYSANNVLVIYSPGPTRHAPTETAQQYDVKIKETIERISQEREVAFTVKNISKVLADSGVHLIPQMENNFYPKIDGIKPIDYELLDGSVIMYQFTDVEQLSRVFNQVRETYTDEVKAYTIDNILVVYVPGRRWLTLMEHTDRVDASIQEALQGIATAELNNLIFTLKNSYFKEVKHGLHFTERSGVKGETVA